MTEYRSAVVAAAAQYVGATMVHTGGGVMVATVATGREGYVVEIAEGIAPGTVDVILRHAPGGEICGRCDDGAGINGEIREVAPHRVRGVVADLTHWASDHVCH